MSKRKPYNDTAGYVASRKCVKGGHIVILDRKNGADWIDADERWIVVHFPSSGHVSVATRETAYTLMKDTAQGNDVAGIILDENGLLKA